jgi:hypothetical protein
VFQSVSDNFRPFQDDPAIAECFRDMHKIVTELSEELDKVLKRGDKSDTFAPQIYSQVERRLIMRSIFSYIEAVVFSMKRTALERHPEALTDGEKMLAAEAAFELSEAGQVVKRAAKVSLGSNIKFAFAIFSKAYKTWSPLNLVNPGWQSLLRSIKARDRITHPKSPSDLQISDAELDDAHTGLNWFGASLSITLIEGLAVIEAEIKRIGMNATTRLKRPDPKVE